LSLSYRKCETQNKKVQGEIKGTWYSKHSNKVPARVRRRPRREVELVIGFIVGSSLRATFLRLENEFEGRGSRSRSLHPAASLEVFRVSQHLNCDVRLVMDLGRMRYTN